MHLLLNDCQLFRRLLTIGNGSPKIGNICAGFQLAPPKPYTAIRYIVANQVCSDLHEPRTDTGKSSKLLPCLKGSDKAILRQIFGSFAASQRCQDEAENPGSVKPYERIEVSQPVLPYFARHRSRPRRPA